MVAAPSTSTGSDYAERIDAGYDVLVALATAEHGVDLATCDARAEATYEMVGVRIVVAG